MAETEIASLNLYQKLARITGEVGAIKKGGRNTQQNFDFIEYAAVAGQLRGLFSKYGVIIVPRMQQTSNQTRQVNGKAVSVLIDFTFNVVNADKPEDRFTVLWTGEAIDYGDKATNKAATSALKYYLMRQFNISEKGEDPDAESPELPAPKPASRPAASTPPQHVADVIPGAENVDGAAAPSGVILSQIRAKIKALDLDAAARDSILDKAKTQRDAEKIMAQLQEKLDARGYEAPEPSA